MKKRTFFRILIDNLILNNAFCKAVISFVNFCNEQSYYKQKELKFLKKMPLNNIENQKTYEKRFLFNSNQSSGVSYK